MDKWEFKPNTSVGRIIFGMNRGDVHKLFDVDCKEFKKSKFSKNTTDDYGKFHVYYTEDDKVDAVEVFEGIEILLKGKVIFPIKSQDIEITIPGISYEDGYYTHKGYSIGIEANGSDAKCILLGARGYYY
ncbi:hypothetical protein [Oribacterium sp. FC2011]|uniref:hypothetical protein n=1 Tax=Oribacterium sp. FC2011 TaxID=1408311 RepID=UPI0004E15BBA|nr:hypothetical protein [Oribacterium sp. FC2011]